MNRLSVTLRWLSGGSYLDISLCHSLSVSSVFDKVDDTIKMLKKCLDRKFSYNDENWLRAVSDKFSRGTQSAL